jgi:glycosyltransferase involved in cell wall biosynthesis
MDWSAQCAVVIPCLNEAGTIASIVGQCRRHLPTVIVVDDGSSDDTSRQANQAGAQVLRHDRPQGKGVALELGWGAALQAGFTWAMTLDGDGQHAPEDIPSFLARASATEARLIIGNRMGHASRMPLVRRWVNRWVSRQLSGAAGQEFPDALCGFRLVHLPAWSRLLLQTKNFEVESELLMAFHDAGHGIDFVPVQLIYHTERSKIHPVRDTVRWFRWYRGRRRGKGGS